MAGKSFDYLIMGGGIAGVSAAEAIRVRDARGTIAIIGDELPDLYSRVLLPGYVKGSITRDQLFLRRAGDFSKRAIKVVQGKVVSVLPERSHVVLDSGEALGYGKLLIASGGRARHTPDWGLDATRVYYLQTFEDAERLKRDIRRIKKVLVVGGGFIALEFLGILDAHTIPALLIAKDDRLLSRFISEEAGAVIHENARSRGVLLYFQDEIKEARTLSSGEATVTTKGGRSITCDAIFVGVGIERNLEFLNNTGIERGREGIVTNEYLETAVPNIYAAGDVAELYDVLLEEHRVLGNWNNAFLQGTAAGKSMAGRPAGASLAAGERTPFRNVSGYAIMNLGLHIAVLGKTGDAGQSARGVASAPSHRYEEMWVDKKGRMQGAVLINAPTLQAEIRAAIAAENGTQEERN